MQPWGTIYAIRNTLEFTPDVSSLAFLSGASRFTKLPLYTCRDASTNQPLFMQNKPNVKDAQINVNSYMESKYEKLDTWLSGKNKPNSNPIKPNLKRAEMNVSYVKTTNYEQKTMNYANNKQTQFPKCPK